MHSMSIENTPPTTKRKKKREGYVGSIAKILNVKVFCYQKLIV